MVRRDLNDWGLVRHLSSLSFPSIVVSGQKSRRLRLPSMCIPASKAEAAWPFLIQPLKPHDVTSAIFYWWKHSRALLTQVEGDTDPISPWNENERIFCHVLKPPLSYFWYIYSQIGFCGLTGNLKILLSSVSMVTMHLDPSNQLTS